jgi:hypothetical protein
MIASLSQFIGQTESGEPLFDFTPIGVFLSSNIIMAFGAFIGIMVLMYVVPMVGRIIWAYRFKKRFGMEDKILGRK